jgi:hypothetical protein
VEREFIEQVRKYVSRWTENVDAETCMQQLYAALALYDDEKQRQEHEAWMKSLPFQGITKQGWKP